MVPSRLTLVASHLTRPLTSATATRTLTKMTTQEPAITLYTVQTPNGIKASILLEELGLPYTVKAISLSKNEQKEPWFLQINPNGRIPAITDSSFSEGGEPIRVFESGSILQYLVDRYDKEHKLSYSHGSREYYEVNNWLFWQMGGLGPMQGQANHFFRYAPEKIDYGIQRYQGETSRLYGVLESQLAKSTSGFLVGDRLTIADIACWGWVNAHDWAGVSLDDFPKLNEWKLKLAAREAFQKGRDVPAGNRKNTKLTKEEEEKIAKEAQAWILQGNQHTKKQE